MALTVEQIQAQMSKSFDQIRSLSAEFGDFNAKVDYLHNDRILKEQQIEELKSANRQLLDALQSATGGAARTSDIKLIDMKGTSQKKSDGKVDSPYRACANGV